MNSSNSGVPSAFAVTAVEKTRTRMTVLRAAFISNPTLAKATWRVTLVAKATRMVTLVTKATRMVTLLMRATRMVTLVEVSSGNYMKGIK